MTGTDELGYPVVLLMFDCPFFYRMPASMVTSDEDIQIYLDKWRKTNGDDWLERVGPAMKLRELKNIERRSK